MTGAKKFPLVTQIYLKRTCKPLYTASILARYFAWAIDQLHIKIHPGQLYPLGSIGPGKERTYTPLAHSLVGPIGPGRGREQCASSPLPSTTCWSEKGGEESMILLLCLWDCAGLIQEEGERGVVLLQTGWDRLTGWQFLPSSPDGKVQEKM